MRNLIPIRSSTCLTHSRIPLGDSSLGVKGINAYLVPADSPGYSVAKNEKKMGIKGSSTSQITLDEVKVGPEAMLGKPGEVRLELHV